MSEHPSASANDDIHAYFITAARGHITDEKALEEALRNKQIQGAGLDVFAKEPPALDHPLLKFDNVIASPHTAGVTKEARTNMESTISSGDLSDVRPFLTRASMICGSVMPGFTCSGDNS